MPVLADDQPSSQPSSRLRYNSSFQIDPEDQCVSLAVNQIGEPTNVPTCCPYSQGFSDHTKEPSTKFFGEPKATLEPDTTPGDESLAASADCSFETDIEHRMEVKAIQSSIDQSLANNTVGGEHRRPRRKKTKSTTIGRFEVSREYFTSSSTTPGGGSQNMSDHVQSQKGSPRDLDRDANKRKDKWLRMFDFSMTRYVSPSTLPPEDFGEPYVEVFSSNVAEPGRIIPSLISGRRCSSVAATKAQVTTAPLAIPKPFPRQLCSSVDSSWTMDDNVPSLGSIGSMDSQARNNSYDEFGSSTSSAAVFSHISALTTSTSRPLIDFDEVVASRRPAWIPYPPASTSSTGSTSLSSSANFSGSPESTWHAFNFEFHPSIHAMQVEAEAQTPIGRTRRASVSGRSLPSIQLHHTDVPLNRVHRVTNTPSSSISSRPSTQWLGARREETTNLPLWSPSPLTLSQCLTSRSSSFSSLTAAAVPAETSATTATTAELSFPTMTSSLAQALAKLTSSAAAKARVASTGDDLPSERNRPYDGPTSQAKLRSVRARVPAISCVPDELHPGFAAVVERMTLGTGVWSGDHT